MKKTFTFALIVLMTLIPPQDSLGQPYDAVFDSLLMEKVLDESPGLTVLVAKEGQVLYRKAFGNADLELAVSLKPEHLFRIGSLTKQFTAAAILRLAEEGKLALNDSLAKFVRDYPEHGRAVTIEQLLTHTSGVPNLTRLERFNSALRTDLTPKELVDLFKDEPLDFPAGSSFRYSNSGYILLGYIIELVSGQAYGEYINDIFFKPLGMNESSYDYPFLIIPGRASGYRRGNHSFENADYLSMTLPYAAGALLSSVDDLLIWHEALMNDQVLPKAIREQAHTARILPDGKVTGYGYGWEVGNIQGSPTIKHVGRIHGFVTFVLYMPVERVFVAIFSNCECTTNLEVPASQMAALVVNKPYKRKRIELSSRELERRQGVYASMDGQQRIVAYEDARLVYFNRGGSKAQLVPYSRNGFFY